jgi:hypothetical protein
MDMVDPKRTNDLILMLDPTVKKSKTDKQLENLLTPYTLQEEPSRTHDRIETALPNDDQSRTETVEPNIVNP